MYFKRANGPRAVLHEYRQMNVRQVAFQALLRLCATELVSVLYSGLLGKESGPGGLPRFAGQLRGSSDLLKVLNELCGSDEHWQRLIDAKSSDIVRAIYKGLLDREPEPEALKGYADRLVRTHDLGLLLTEISRSDEHWRRATNFRAPEIVRALYRGLLDREPEPNALMSYATKLVAMHDVSSLLAELASSTEHWNRALEKRSTELVRALYRGLLQREPEAEALEAYSTRLRESHDVASLMMKIGRSTEQWHRTLEARAPELVRALYQGLMQREPEPEVADAYALKLRETHDVALTAAAMSKSDEMWNQLLAVRAPQIVESIYQSLLEREADSLGLSTYSNTVTEPNGIKKVLSTVVGSIEFNKLHQRQGVVFLHIQKTAGTSIQAMMQDAFGKEVYGEHADSLGAHSPKTLSAYSVFSGHFNHDSLSFIPCRRLNIFTFVREPKERLISHYYFWRAHEPTAPGWGGGQKLANELLIEDFFAREGVKQSFALWNHMTWAIMGQKLWDSWRLVILKEPSASKAHFILNKVRPAIRQRIREFAFVGLQKDFERSVDLLCETLKWPRFKSVRTEHSLERLTQSNPHFKKRMVRQPMTERLDSLLDDCVELDNIVYEEAQMLYVERLTQSGQGATLGPKRIYDNEVTAFSVSDLKEFKLILLCLPRTGAAALHSILASRFDKKWVWPEGYNALRHHPAGELARYRFFSGQFDLPSIGVIPGQKRIITMLRVPCDRLVSLYHWLRAHRPEAIERQGLELAGLANTKSIADFFRHDKVRSHPWVNNAMCRMLTQTMDGSSGNEGREGDAPAKLSQPNAALALRELKALDSFGLVERFDDSVGLILSAIGLTIPKETATERSSDAVPGQGPGARKTERQPITSKVREIIGELIAADLEIYEQAKQIFETRHRSAGRQTTEKRGRLAK